MKKIFVVLIFFVFFIGFCFVSVVRKMHWMSWHHDISVQVRETDNIYQVYASYNRDRTGRIERYIDAQLHTNHLFRNSRVNATITLDDKTSVYVRTAPGKVLIKLDKSMNDAVSYLRIKELGEGLKQQLTQTQ